MIGGKKKWLLKPNHNVPLIDTYISKIVIDENGTKVKGIDVKTHCLITGYVAQALLNIFPNEIKEFLFPPATAFLAACHDIGKISPAFQKMIHSFLTNAEPEILSLLEGVNADTAKRTGYAFHAKVTKSFLSEKSAYISEIEGMHHGFKPNSSLHSEIVYGGELWSAERQKLLSFLEEHFLNTEEAWPEISNWNKACVLGGFITVADWIASGGSFADFTLGKKTSDSFLRELAFKAVCNAGFSPIKMPNDLSFADIFGFEPYSVQKTFFDRVKEPGVYVLEAPMGHGKTEAALYAAYRMISGGKAAGLYFALPTQLTSNRIYERVAEYLNKIMGDSSHDLALKLLHSSAWLENSVLGEEGSPGRSWFNSAKRGILAPFAVGTIDQALMAVMNIKHGMVRAFGLAGKVVILDEVHSYDSFTGTILNRLVDFLRDANSTVIILSATLTAGQKKNILKIPLYQSLSSAYPLTSFIQNAKRNLVQLPSYVENEKSITISIKHTDFQVIAQVLEKAENGEQVIWIENTVSEAQEVFKKISARVSESNIECGLIHSRFIKAKRNSNEQYWSEIFGKDGHKNRKACGRILIGTQVLEQSLDIDADFMVTRICPIDMLLQRFGRLWRHSKNNRTRPAEASCSSAILSPQFSDALNKDACFGLSASVYSEYVLCRTLEAVNGLTSIHLPADIRLLLESVYSDRKEEGRISTLKAELQRTKDRLEGMARVGLSVAAKTFPESAAQTRYSEIETVSVLLIHSFIPTDNGCTIILYGENTPVQIPKKCKSMHEKRRIAKLLMEHCVVVSEKNAPPPDRQIQIFSSYIYVGKIANIDDDEESPFRIAIVGKDNYLRTLHNTIIEKDAKKFLYFEKLGYQIIESRRM
ncbi:MAG: CRISPR-associated helicase Cas3' [Treponema sp.]|nr:CRISPR-associated helicase Cas3' [Treponema sp.]